MRHKSPTEIPLEHYQHADKFGEWLGYQVDWIDREHHKASVGLEIREDHLSPAGRVHGGVISAYFDYAAGAAVFTTLEKKDFCSTIELKVNYFRPIELGDRLRVEMQVMFRGKRVCVVHGLAYRENGENPEKPVAMATATFNVVSAEASRKPKAPKSRVSRKR